MKSIITITTALTLCVLTSFYAHAQETEKQTNVEQSSVLKQTIIQEEKDGLKAEIESINARLENKSISGAEAAALKKKAAEKHALNIENRLAIIDNQTALNERNGQEGENGEEDKSGTSVSISIGNENADNERVFGVSMKGKKKKVVYDRRTTSGANIAFGLNNVITKGESFNKSDFEVGGSRFFEIGWSWKTRVFENSNWLRVKYGLSFQFNGIKPTDNRYFVDTGEQTELQTHPLKLNKSKFRMDNLVVPLHFEFGPSEKVEREDYFRYKTHSKIRVGLGGYAGLNLGVRQKLKYEEDGNKIKQKLKSGYNSNNVIYGLSGYVGWGITSLYAKYDLNTIFTDNPVDQRNISVGLRLDFD
ncbi:hypothetical protein [Aequorivita viscosa]|uniref:Outer membrane protein beta-barrel domain-containing protein n=1 Tax=Aequorivita viscosa TaxID=797419 RepID=A0A1M6CRT3_9FLAO|nr:hypothetical protein [Aequorivita viscosa]SDW39866.1 hypothetical protein SAMN05216556_10553 [Aequorivita viscosa]SHI63573.1 hypothetical protein SAMN04487908_10454 [Aequorivita viscosa]